MQPNVSVCICTRNRPDELKSCLESIRRSTVPVYETVVSDDSTDDRTARMLTDIPAVASVVYVQGPRIGLGANRNAALAAASGDYILFLDDDARLGEHYLQEALSCAAAQRDPMTVVTGYENNRGVLIKAHDQSFLGFQNVPYRGNFGLKTIVINSTLFPRTVFSVTRFDEHLVYGCEEVDIALQAVRQGYQIVQSDNAVNFHYPSLVNRSYYRPHLDVSRLYVTFKRYALYERAWLKAVTFALLGPLHCMLAAAKRRGLTGMAEASRSIAAAARLSAASLRHS